MISKKIKVRITAKVAAFYYPNATGQRVKHVPGDTVEIEADLFRPDFMTKVEPTPVKKPELVDTEIPEKLKEKMKELPSATKEFPGDVSEKPEPEKKKEPNKPRRR